MQNKGFFWFLTIALALACFYQISFTWVSSSVESEASQQAAFKLDSTMNAMQANGQDFTILGSDTVYVNSDQDKDIVRNYFEADYLRQMQNESVYPLFGHTYKYCKEHEMNFGLDLRGGMSVTLEVSIPDMVNNLAGESRNPKFLIPYRDAVEQYENKGGEFIQIFQKKFEERNGKDEKMAAIFTLRNKDLFPANSTNDEIVEILEKEANEALDGVEKILEKRINQFGVAQPSIQKQAGTSRIIVELPGIKDKESVRRKLQSTANLEFYETYRNITQDGGMSVGPLLFNQVEPALSKALKSEKGLEEEEIETTEEVDIESEVVEDSTSMEDNNEEIVENDETEESSEETDGNVLDDLLSEEQEDDTSGLDVDDVTEGKDSADVAEMSREEQLMEYPLSSYLAPYVNEQNNFLEGPIVGYAQIQDTGKVNQALSHPVVQGLIPEDLAFMWDAKPMTGNDGEPTNLLFLYGIKKEAGKPQVTGDDIYNARQDMNMQAGAEVVVSMEMTSRGAEKWGEMTTKNVGKFVAITMDGTVFSAPRVNEPMTDGRSQISGNFSVEEAQDLAGLLKAGALPAPAKIVDETVVGPSLGAENISSGLWSFLIALLLVLIYMAFYYSKAGLVADIALVANIFFLFGSLASMGAILTLPGIAGIVLTIGMSVDANVLIFERIREEITAGKGMKQALKDGYNNAYSAILDANITTLLTAIVLASFGTGPIKGFAITLIIGIFTSLFAAIVITRLVFTSLLDRKKKISFGNKLTMNAFNNINLPFIAKRKIFYVVSGLIIIGGLASLLTSGLDYGVEFTGGRTYKVVFEEKPDFAKMRNNLEQTFVDEEGVTYRPEVKMISDSYTAMITTKYMINSSADGVDSLVEARMSEGLTDFGAFEVEESRKVNPSISDDLKQSSLLAVIFSLVIIFLYIFIRFRKWQYGLGALFAVAHDVIIVLSIFSIFKTIMPFSMEIDQAFIAAILTVVGYSINDTVVVFDRIREFLGLYRRKEENEIVNDALNSTLSRTINTSLSTFLVLLMIFIFGGETIRGFTFALMIGVVVGTYSSLCIATPTLVDFTKRLVKKK